MKLIILNGRKYWYEITASGLWLNDSKDYWRHAVHFSSLPYHTKRELITQLWENPTKKSEWVNQRGQLGGFWWNRLGE